MCVTVKVIVMRPCRPFDPSKQTAESGAWCWVGVPKSLLINGKGNYHECEDPYSRQVMLCWRDGSVSVA